MFLNSQPLKNIHSPMLNHESTDLLTVNSGKEMKGSKRQES